MSEDPIKAAFRKGIEASKKADSMRAEVDRVVQDVASKIAEETGNAISISLEETGISKVNRFLSELVSITRPRASETESESKKVHVIIAQIQGWDASPQINLCIVKFARDIFPIELQWETESLICRDSKELAIGLVTMISDSRTGRKFLQLMAKREEMKELPLAGSEGVP